MTMHCCFIPAKDAQHFEQATTAADVFERGCQRPAEYEIRDMEDHNPYTSVTFACTAHVGVSLGSSLEGTWKEGDPQRWEVVPLSGSASA